MIINKTETDEMIEKVHELSMYIYNEFSNDKTVKKYQGASDVAEINKSKIDLSIDELITVLKHLKKVKEFKPKSGY